jgi:hypothetical protein
VDHKSGPSPRLLESHGRPPLAKATGGRQAEGYGPALRPAAQSLLAAGRSVRAGRPQGGGPRCLVYSAPGKPHDSQHSNARSPHRPIAVKVARIGLCGNGRRREREDGRAGRTSKRTPSARWR